jgi:proline iminopeptidase
MHSGIGREFTVNTPGAIIRGRLVGQGPPIVMLHGGPGCYDYFSGSPLVEWLAESRSVWSYDQRGCRDSLSNGPFSLAANVDDLDAIRRHVDVERVALFGHSAGAVLAVHYAATHPANVETLILCSPAGVRPGWRANFETALRRRHTPQQRAELSRIDHEILRTDDHTARAQLYRLRFNFALPSYLDERHRSRAPTLEFYNRDVDMQVGASMQAACSDLSWSAGLARFRGPTCLIHGRSDPIPWKVVDDLLVLLPQAMVFPLDHCGHFPWLEEPQAMRASLFAFLGPGG